MSIRERFIAKIAENAETGCWEWTGARDRKGYARFGIGGKNRTAHRVAYELFVGPVPEGLTLDHLCRVRHCVNPAHLDPVTAQENTRRGIPHNRAKTRCANGHPFDAENTAFTARGSRVCIECRRATGRRFAEAQRRERGAGLAFAARTHCPRGHAYDETNTYWYDGRRQCKACRATRVRARRSPGGATCAL